MIEYPSTPESFQPAINRVLTEFSRVKIRDQKTGKAVIMLHEDELKALVDNLPEPTEWEKKILAADANSEGSVTFKNIDEMYEYFGVSKED